MASARKRDKYLRRHYGLTLRQYELMLKRQKGRCAICGKTPKRSLHVDHDHVTGRVRGLLDYYCNRRVIGRLRNATLMERAAKYLRSSFDGRALGVDGRSFRGARRSSSTPNAQSDPS